MGEPKKDVTPVRLQWSYVLHALTHEYELLIALFDQATQRDALSCDALGFQILKLQHVFEIRYLMPVYLEYPNLSSIKSYQKWYGDGFKTAVSHTSARI